MSMNKQERDRLSKVKDTLLQELLKQGLCVDDVLHTKGETEGGKPREKLLTAFTRGYVHLKEEKVAMVGKLFDYADLEGVFREMDFMPISRHLSLAKTISLSDVQTALKMAGMQPWREMNYETKLEVLWNMGLAVKLSENPTEDEDASRYYIDRKHHRNANNKVEYGLCITANERTDKEWKASPHCSYEAKIHTNDEELARELRDMSRTRVS